MKTKQLPKPRVNFCWECGRTLWNQRHEIMRIYGEDKILHKQCAKDLKAHNYYR